MLARTLLFAGFERLVLDPRLAKPAAASLVRVKVPKLLLEHCQHCDNADRDPTLVRERGLGYLASTPARVRALTRSTTLLPFTQN